jgi:hypothetical protein
MGLAAAITPPAALFELGLHATTLTQRFKFMCFLSIIIMLWTNVNTKSTIWNVNSERKDVRMAGKRHTAKKDSRLQ